jgi:hypothetical protein
MTTKLQSTIKAMVTEHGIVRIAKKARVTPVSLQAFLHGSEIYKKTKAKLHKLAGIPLPEEKPVAKKTKKAKNKVKAKPPKKVAPKTSKKKKSKSRKKKPSAHKAMNDAAARATKAAKPKKKSKAKKKHASTKSKSTANGVSGPVVAAEDEDEELNAALEA